jgi:hypothetical protein
MAPSLEAKGRLSPITANWKSQSMITANYMCRTFRIKCGNSSGSGFTIDVNGREYLITARHVVQMFA